MLRSSHAGVSWIVCRELRRVASVLAIKLSIVASVLAIELSIVASWMRSGTV
ncbi:hypothetical protein F2Q69_00019238 [Brassica cretica]|uniref:Uncharacterized protein n=1 Tax=Brassica cretica TaxID=69181 RepID=A0A8S9QAG8_BRACR|nr:hypothetical protein F2Q69_00019238 [Brassica cretica]